MLGFNGENVILEATWARPGGGKVPWEALNATQFNPTSGARESFHRCWATMAIRHQDLHRSLWQYEERTSQSRRLVVLRARTRSFAAWEARQ